MGLAKRRERERNDVREKILEAAGKLLILHGYNGISMRKIAAEIDYSPTVIYSHFSDKQALLKALVDKDYLTLTSNVARHARERHPLTRLRLIGKEIINFALENPNHYLILNKIQHPFNNSLKKKVVTGSALDDANAIVVKTIHEAIQQGYLRSVLRDAELVTHTFFAGIHGVIAMGMGNSKSEGINWQLIEDRLNMMIDLLIHGLMHDRQCA